MYRHCDPDFRSGEAIPLTIGIVRVVIICNIITCQNTILSTLSQTHVTQFYIQE